MKYLLLLLIMFAIGCGELRPKPTQEQLIAKAEENARYDAGPKYKAGCYKIINKNNPDFGCTFQSTQGSMFVNTYRDSREKVEYRNLTLTELRDEVYTMKWQLIFNRRIRCLNTRVFFVPEKDVRKIKCPEHLYKD